MRSSSVVPAVSDGPWTRNLLERDIRRILIIKWSGIGDVAIATATIQDIRDAFPDASMDLNTMAPCDRLFRDDPRFDDVFCFDLRGSERSMAGHWRWLRYPEFFNHKHTRSAGQFFVHWVDEDMKRETLEARKNGTTFEPQINYYEQWKE